VLTIARKEEDMKTLRDFFSDKERRKKSAVQAQGNTGKELLKVKK
jgi:hypothetical protein